jgi:uncharacterized LabA/DUF88 family protein
LDNVIVYIDGFNLYYGLKSKGWKRYYWLNLHTLSEKILKPDQQLVEIKYFTSRISTSDQDKKKRQDTFLEALGTLKKFRIFYGHYLLKPIRCRNCGTTWNAPEEKMTDVCIATELIFDAINDRFNTAILVSGDSDLIPPIDRVKKHFPNKKIGIAFPPDRESNALKKHADYNFMIQRTKFRESVFPNQIITHNGIVLKCPKEWK